MVWNWVLAFFPTQALLRERELRPRERERRESGQREPAPPGALQEQPYSLRVQVPQWVPELLLVLELRWERWPPWGLEPLRELRRQELFGLLPS